MEEIRRKGVFFLENIKYKRAFFGNIGGRKRFLSGVIKREKGLFSEVYKREKRAFFGSIYGRKELFENI